MQIGGISMVKNEADIIEAFVRHTLTFVHHLVVLDNGSTDNTSGILRALAAEGLALSVVEHHTVGKYQPELMTRLMREHALGLHQADWVLALDADEFIDTLDGGPLITTETSSACVLTLPWRTYVPTAADDMGQTNPVERMQRRVVGKPELVKVLVPRQLAARPGAGLASGNHQLLIDGEPCPTAQSQAYLAHFPIRSPGQYLAKVAITALQYRAMPGRDPRVGGQYRKPFETLKRDPTAFKESFLQAGHFYPLFPMKEEKQATVVDPFPYRGGPLVHTAAGNDDERGWCSVLAYAENLASEYAVLLQRWREVTGTTAPHGSTLCEQARRRIDLEAIIHEQHGQLMDKELQLERQHRLLERQHRQLSCGAAFHRVHSWIRKVGRLLGTLLAGLARLAFTRHIPKT
jgi:hypothetical protein